MPKKWFSSRSFIFSLALIVAGVLAALAISRETPLGTVTGKVIRKDNGMALVGARVYHPIRGTFVKTDNSGFYSLYGVQQGKQTIRVDAPGFHDAYNSNVVITEGRTTGNINFSLIRRDATYSVYTYQKVFPPAETPSVNLRGYMVKKVQVNVYRVNPAEYLNKLTRSDNLNTISTKGLELAKEVTVKCTLNSEGEFEEPCELPIERNGLYMVVTSAVGGSQRETTWFSKSDLGMVVKESPKELLIYAQNFSTGKPVKDVKVRILRETRQIAAGITDKNGLCTYAFTSITPANRNFEVIAEQGDNFAFSSSYSGGTPSANKTYLFTERPVYRPGHTVFFKGISRNRLEDAYTVTKNQPVTVKVTDTNGNMIYHKTIQTSEFGTFSDTFHLAENSALGSYNILAVVNGNDSYASFEVSEYKKPEYKVEVSTDKPHYVTKDKISVKVKGTYFFGAPVKGSDYRLVVFESPYYYGEGYDDYLPDNSSYGGVLFETSGTLDEKGEANVTIPTSARGYSRSLSIEAEVTDISGRTATGNSNVTLSAGEFGLYAQTGSYIVNPGQNTNLDIAAEYFDGKPAVNQLVKVIIKQIKYEEVEVKPVSNSGYRRSSPEYRMKMIENPVGQPQNLFTDKDGKAVLAFKPEEAGSYTFEVSSVDKRGNLVKHVSYLYVSGSGDGGTFSDADLKIITDKKRYNRGEKVKAVITSSKPKTYVLLTVEGRQIHRKQVLYLDKGSVTVDIPLEKSYFPNVFISVAAIKDMHLVTDMKNIKFNRDEKKLAITVKPDKKKYTPGEKAKFTITVKDQKGKPVRGEFSMGVVDEAIYSIARDNTPDIHEFFWSYDYNFVDTSYSFSRDYSGGVDKDRPQRIRKNFKDTAHWAPSVVTNDRGEATVEFEMPDNLTTWVSTIRCATADTLVGSTANFTLCTKDLLVRLETPRFLTQRDKLFISGIVHNYTEKEQKVKVWLEAEGVQMANLEKVEDVIQPGDARDYYWEVEAVKTGNAKFTLLCKGDTAEDAMELELPVLPYGVEEIAAKTSHLLANPANETVALMLPEKVISEASQMELSLSPSLAGTIFGNLDYLIHYPYGCVEQTMSSFLPAIMATKALGQLNLHDESIEKQLPDVVTRGLTRLYDMQHSDGGWGWWEYDQTHPVMTAYVTMGLDDARKLGYNVRKSSIDSGVKAIQKMVKKPVGPVKSYGDSYQEGEDWNTRMYLLYALYKTGNPEFKMNLEAFEHRKPMNAYAKALLTLTLQGTGETVKAQRVLAELDKQAKDDTKTQTCYWDGRTYDYSWMDNNIETTAYILQAYMAIRPEDPKVIRAIRWIVSQRIGTAYTSTKDTAAVVLAFVDYLNKSKELTPGYQLDITLNGKNLVKQQVGKAQLPPEIARMNIGPDRLQTGANTVMLAKDGPGALYYTSRLRYYSNVDKIEPKAQGIKVSRTYQVLNWKKNSDGSGSDVPGPLPNRPLTRGERLRVTVTIEPDRDYKFVLIEDPLPAGFEVMMSEEEKNWGSLWYCRQEVHDEKISFFSRDLTKGKKMVLTYDIRAEMSGNIKVLPASAYLMYSPEIRGHSASADLQVELKK